MLAHARTCESAEYISSVYQWVAYFLEEYVYREMER